MARADSARVLITGAGGLIGRQVVASLLALGVEVHAASRRPLAVSLPETVQLHGVDLLDEGARRRLLETVRPTHVLHLAWVTTHGYYWNAPENDDWATATVALGETFAEVGGERFVGVGSCAEYDWTDPVLASGDCNEKRSPVRPQTLYGKAKDRARRGLAAHARERGTSSAWARLFFPFGAGEDYRRFFPSIIEALRDNRPANCSEGTQLRDLLSAVDTGPALAQLLLSDVEGPVNIASGEPRRLADVALTIGRLMGREELIALGGLPMPAHEPPRLVADVRRLRDEVGFEQVVPFERRVLELIEAITGAEGVATRAPRTSTAEVLERRVAS